MGSKRRKGRARREPVFDQSPSATLEVRLDPQDRPGGPPAPAKPDTERRRRPVKSEARPRRRGGGGRKSDGAGGARQRSKLGRAIYWSLVLCLWLLIAAGGVIAWVGAHLPAIQSLEVPKRPPSI